MIVSIIVAMDRNRGIGRQNALPWKLSADLKRFRELTMGHVAVFGRKTYESIGRPLPGRRMVVVSRDPRYHAEGCTVVGSLNEALHLARSLGEEELFVCGGAEIYTQALPQADRIYLTTVSVAADCDTHFPALNESEWATGAATFQPADEKNQYPSTFRVLNRIAGKASKAG